MFDPLHAKLILDTYPLEIYLCDDLIHLQQLSDLFKALVCEHILTQIEDFDTCVILELFKYADGALVFNPAVNQINLLDTFALDYRFRDEGGAEVT